jgi:hypothetical protein
MLSYMFNNSFATKKELLTQVAAQSRSSSQAYLNKVLRELFQGEELCSCMNNGEECVSYSSDVSKNIRLRRIKDAIEQYKIDHPEASTLEAKRHAITLVDA